MSVDTLWSSCRRLTTYKGAVSHHQMLSPMGRRMCAAVISVAVKSSEERTQLTSNLLCLQLRANSTPSLTSDNF